MNVGRHTARKPHRFTAALVKLGNLEQPGIANGRLRGCPHLDDGRRRNTPDAAMSGPENTRMRWVRDLALLIVIAGFIGGGVIMLRQQRDQEALVQQVAAELVRMETEVKFRSATRGAELNARGWPVTVDPKWFQPRPPMNTLVSPDRPWVEVANMSEAGLTHPPVRVTIDTTLAAFWYNPYQGIVRARVPAMVNDERTLQVYNRINGSGLSSLFVRETPIPTPDLIVPANPDATAVADAGDGSGSSANGTTPGGEVETTSHPPEAGTAAGEGAPDSDGDGAGDKNSDAKKNAEPYGPPVVKVDRNKPKK